MTPFDDERLGKMARRIRQAVEREQERFARDDDAFYCDAIALAFAGFHDKHWQQISDSRAAYVNEGRRRYGDQEQAAKQSKEAPGG